MSIKLDLHRFKYHSSDKDSTTLVHSKDGHKITLAHKSLSPENQTALASLSKGIKQDQTPVQAEEAKAGMAEGGKVKTIPSKSAAEGLKKAETVGKGGYRPTHGIVIQIDHPDKKEPGPGKITDEKGEPAKPYADGGSIMDSIKQTFQPSPPPVKDFQPASQIRGKYADGGEPQPEIPQALDPNATPQVSPQDASALGNQTPQPQGQQLDPNAQAVRIRYDDLLARRAGSMIDDKTNQAGKPDPMTTFAGSQGSEPKDLNPDLLAQAQADVKYNTEQRAHEDQLSLRKQIGVNQARAAAGLSPQPINTGAGQPSISSPIMDSGAPTAGPAQPMDRSPQSDTNPDITTDPSQMLQQGVKNKIEGVQGEGQAAQQAATQQASAEQNQAAAMSKAQGAYQSNYDDLNQERLNHIQDIQNGHIDPNKYWSGYDVRGGDGSLQHVDGHSKVAAGIGMILAGFNPTNQPNAAINMLQNQMQQSLLAQGKNQDMNHNLLLANSKQFDNLRLGADMTRVMMNDALSHQIQAAALKAQGGPNGIIMNRAKQAIGQIQQENFMTFRNLAMMKSIGDLSKNGDSGATDQLMSQLQVINPELYKTMAEKYVPGVGVGTVPVPAASREKLVAYQKVQQQAADLYNFTKQHTTIVPGTPAYNVGAQMALGLQSSIREGQLGTVYKAGEQPLLDKFVNSNPAGAFKLLQTQPQLQEIIRSNGQQMNILKKSYGLPVQQPASPQQNQTIKIKGIDYKLDAQGNAHRVK